MSTALFSKYLFVFFKCHNKYCAMNLSLRSYCTVRLLYCLVLIFNSHLLARHPLFVLLKRRLQVSFLNFSKISYWFVYFKTQGWCEFKAAHTPRWLKWHVWCSSLQRGFMFNFWLDLKKKKNCLLCFVELFGFLFLFYSSPLRDFSLMLQLSQIDVTD